MACSFGIESMARGYHEYKSVWEDPVHGEELNYKGYRKLP